MTTDAARVATARRWFKRLSYDPVEDGAVTVVDTPAFPDSWDANWAQPAPHVHAQAVSDALLRHRHPGSRWQVVATDCLCDPSVEAALALADFSEGASIIEMLAGGPLASPHPLPPIEVEAVGDADWRTFAALVEADHREGKRTGGHDPQVAAGLLDGMRRRLGPCAFWLIHHQGSVAGYGMTAVCPNGLGLIEHLFTLPARRGRGLMSAFIVAASERLREAGCDAIFLDAHAYDRPKHLYLQLGFMPVAVTRTWVRDLSRHAGDR